jgi:hypothetical protein
MVIRKGQTIITLFEHNEQEVTEKWSNMHDEEHPNIFFPPSIIQPIN